jgi:hypothetical protein
VAKTAAAVVVPAAVVAAELQLERDAEPPVDLPLEGRLPRQQLPEARLPPEDHRPQELLPGARRVVVRLLQLLLPVRPLPHLPTPVRDFRTGRCLISPGPRH